MRKVIFVVLAVALACAGTTLAKDKGKEKGRVNKAAPLFSLIIPLSPLIAHG